MFAFLSVKATSKEICEEISFPSFNRKILMSGFLLRVKANYLEKMRSYPPAFFFVDSNSPCKDLLSPRSPNLAQKHMCLVGTVVNSILGSLSTRVFETRTVTGSEVFSLLTCLHSTPFAFPSIFFSIRDAWYKSLGDNTVLTREMSSSGCRPRLKNVRA